MTLGGTKSEKIERQDRQKWAQGTKSEPKGTKGEPKVSQKWAKGSPKWAKKEPKVSQIQHKIRRSKGRQMGVKSEPNST